MIRGPRDADRREHANALLRPRLLRGHDAAAVGGGAPRAGRRPADALRARHAGPYGLLDDVPGAGPGGAAPGARLGDLRPAPSVPAALLPGPHARPPRRRAHPLRGGAPLRRLAHGEVQGLPLPPRLPRAAARARGLTNMQIQLYIFIGLKHVKGLVKVCG